ncbi:MAG: nucleotidyl transferase AbiEii/AbiGii toxin family protein [Oligoflexus sp.]
MNKSKTYASAEAFRAALESKARAESSRTGNPLEAVRAVRAFEAFLLRIKPSGQPVVLKGGFAVYVRFGALSRPTEDLDLAVHRGATWNKSNQLESMKRILDTIAATDMGDFFSFIIGQPSDALGADREFDGWRFPIESRIGGREYKRFHIDMTVGDSILRPLDQVSVGGGLSFAGLPSGYIDTIRLPQHYCEKLHAYVRVRARENSRVKDLFDLVFFIRNGLPSALVAEVIEEVFAHCGGPAVPTELKQPSKSWKKPFEEMTADHEMGLSIEEAYKLIVVFHAEVIEAIRR